MSIISQNKRYLPHDLKTKFYAVQMYRNCHDSAYVCRKYHISKSSLSRWNRKFDGTKESLIDKSHRPLSKHPNAHSDTEIKWIKDLMRRNPNITLNELWYKLKINTGYSRHPASFYRFLKKIGFTHFVNIKNTSKYTPQPYDTPKDIGAKWQIDTKYVPKECKVSLPFDKKFYQLTCIDEATRQRFLYFYEETTPENTVDFINRCINFFGYVPKEIQTDNGFEFTSNRSDIKKVHPFTQRCRELNIYHHTIKPRTPRHNGKVERSHRNDNERFYSWLKFFSLDDLRKQGATYLKRSNNIPMAVLNYLTPNEMRKTLCLWSN